jgi:large subunit ribosomal protein L10e
MGIRPAKAIRDADKVAWTRFSRCKPRKSFIKSMPHADLHQYRMGAMKPDFDACYSLVSDGPIILRDNAIESARQSMNKHMEKTVPGSFYIVVRAYPHHIVRENKMIAGAGADRLQKGMRQAFGRPVDRAARLRTGSRLFTIYTYKTNEPHLKIAFARAQRKVSGSYRIVLEKPSKAG